MSGPADDRASGKSQKPTDDAAEFEARLSELGGKLGKIKAQRDHERGGETEAGGGGRGMAYGMRMATELVAAVIVGGLIGWGLDRFLGTTPWLFLVFFILGFAAGVLNVLRGYEQMRKEMAARNGGNIGRSVPDDED